MLRETDLEAKPQCDLEENQINRQGRTDSWGEVCGENGLNCPLQGPSPAGSLQGYRRASRR